MKLNKLISLNEKFKSDQGLADSFGDNFLVKNNNIYSKVRSRALTLGYSFSNERNLAYETLALSQLNNILKEKKIPYCSNILVLHELEKTCAGTTSWEDVADNFKKNHVFHESAHAVARDLILKADVQNTIMSALIEESFANTCELLAIAEASQPAHRIFLEANSYCHIFEKSTNLKNAILDFGPTAIAKFFILTYLYSNFLYEQISEKNFDRIFKLIGLGPSLETNKIRKLKALAKISFLLNVNFREVTTSFYFRMNKIPQAETNLVAQDPLAIFENEKRANDLLGALAQYC